ncbi:hypothetical protein BC830DRAFT_1234823 [Chytriomyces sp. MP71]|nr:hypothetical protein BC830DRAFT_1234823 [Chytriomyces sp. MP71]
MRPLTSLIIQLFSALLQETQGELLQSSDLAMLLHRINSSTDPEDLIDLCLNDTEKAAFREFAAESLRTAVNEEL